MDNRGDRKDVWFFPFPLKDALGPNGSPFTWQDITTYSWILSTFCFPASYVRFAGVYSEDPPGTCKWLITMVILSPVTGATFPFQMAFLWLIHAVDQKPTY